MDRNLNKGFGETDEIPFEEMVEATEGDVKFLTFPPSKYTGQNHGTSLTKSMPVFYNPVMIFNRDLTLVAYRAFQNLNSQEPKFQTLTICDSMAASGIRAMRLLKFLQPPIKILANDLNPLALRVMKKNCELNGIVANIEYSQEEASFLFSRLSRDHTYYSIVDIDPFGTPNIFVDSALKAVEIGGLVAITATDTPALFGVRPTACLRKYNSKSLYSSFLKEIGLRILIYFAATRAHPHNNYIQPLLSLSTDHYVRIFIRVFKGKEGVNQNYENIGYALWCKKCDWRHSIPFNIQKMPTLCPECGNEIDYGGPLWIGNLHDQGFIQECQKVVSDSNNSTIPTKNRMKKSLEYMYTDHNLGIGYYCIHKICDLLGISVPSYEKLLQAISDLGNIAIRSHIEPTAIKSNIGIKQLKEILLKFESSKQNIK